MFTLVARPTGIASSFMKAVFNTLLFLMLTLLFSRSATSQDASSIYLHEITTEGEIVLIQLRSQHAYYVGGERYYLHIGDYVIELSQHDDLPNEHGLTFLLPLEDFQTLNDGETITLTYGRSPLSNTQWPLGTLEKNQ